MKPPQQPLIGKHATITKAQNPQQVGITGIIEDETKNMITINGKKIIKEQVTITINNEHINGTTIAKTPTERIKVHKQ